MNQLDLYNRLLLHCTLLRVFKLQNDAVFVGFVWWLLDRFSRIYSSDYTLSLPPHYAALRALEQHNGSYISAGRSCAAAHTLMHSDAVTASLSHHPSFSWNVILIPDMNPKQRSAHCLESTLFPNQPLFCYVFFFFWSQPASVWLYYYKLESQFFNFLTPSSGSALAHLSISGFGPTSSWPSSPSDLKP